MLPHLDGWAAAPARRPATGTPRRAWASWRSCRTPAPGARPAWHLYVVRHERADDAIAALGAAGIGARAYYRTPIHRQPAMARFDPPPEGVLPGTDEAARTHLALPVSAAITGARSTRSSAPCAMRVWVDLTNSPHVLVLRPVIALLRERGAEVRVTARDFAQTVGLCERLGLDCEVIGHHRGGRLAAKGVGLVSRSVALARWARGRRFDLALGHGSNDVTVAAWALRVPRSTMFDYEWATVQHTVNCRLADAVVVPEAIPPERLDRYGARGKLGRYPGLKEEYYLHDFEPDDAVLDELGLDPREPIAVVRTPPAVSLYHRFENDRFAGVLQRLRVRRPGRRAPAHARAARGAGARRRLRRARAGDRRPVARRAAPTSWSPRAAR